MRLRLILEHVKRHKTCTLKELMSEFEVSSATIHRDVAALAKRDAVERVRGGLVYREAAAAADDMSRYFDRLVHNRREKAKAARKALDLIEEGDIVFLDSSTTVFELAMLLVHAQFDHLTIITNAVPVMGIFRKYPKHWSMIALGGNFDPQLNSFLGMTTAEQLSHLNITKAFVSAFGLDDKTATTNHEHQAGILKKVLDAADKRYLLLDHTKLGRKGLYRVAARGGFDAIFTDGNR